LADGDLALRAREAGFELAVAHDLFIHSFGGRTFAGNGIDAARLANGDEQRFAASWGHLAPQFECAFRPGDGIGLVIKEMGAHSFYRGQTAENEVAELREQAAYVVECACDPAPNGDGGQTVVDHVRLFPLREDVRWNYCVHEQILPALRRANVPVRWTDVTVRHTGYTNRALRLRKLDRDAKILREERAERPDDPFLLPVSIKVSTATSPAATWQPWPASGAITPRRPASDVPCSPNASMIGRRGSTWAHQMGINDVAG